MESFLMKDRTYPDIMYRKVFLMTDANDIDNKYIYPVEFDTMEKQSLIPAGNGIEIGVFEITNNNNEFSYRGFTIHKSDDDLMPFGVAFAVIRMENDYPVYYGTCADLHSALYRIDCIHSNIEI